LIPHELFCAVDQKVARPARMGGAAVPLVMQTTVTFGPKGQRTLPAHLITPASAAPHGR
jgi:hypothetical protein